MNFEGFATLAVRALEVAGLVAMIAGSAVAVVSSLRKSAAGKRYPLLRQNLGRAILLGLELLVAADIVRTVTITPTLVSVAVLGGIVLIRTFLSFTLEVEIEGRWPWRRGERDVGS